MTKEELMASSVSYAHQVRSEQESLYLFFKPHFRAGKIMYSLGDVLVYHHTGEDVWLQELLLKHSLLFALHVRVREVEVKMWRFNVCRTERL
jgi:hypothetical protein